jgi:hypothetical protein
MRRENDQYPDVLVLGQTPKEKIAPKLSSLCFPAANASDQLLKWYSYKIAYFFTRILHHLFH